MSEVEELPNLGHLPTESVRAELAGLDLLETQDLVELIAADARQAIAAVRAAAPRITQTVGIIAERLAAGGRLIYVGAGTAGRIAVLDAVELGPTFSVPDGVVEAVIAGGDAALRHAIEGVEDDAEAGAQAVKRLGVGPGDVVLGVSASGRTPFVLAALEHAAALGAATIGVSCNAGSRLSEVSQVAVELVVGGEVIAGSSRMNAGTAQKIALNTISTSVMVRLGKTYGNLMVDVRATNSKLKDRATRIVQLIAEVDAQAAADTLEVAGWNVKLASLIAASGKDAAAAGKALEATGGRLREALALLSPGDRRTRSSWRRLGVSAAFVDGELVPGDVATDGEHVVAVGLPASGSRIAVPGLVDLQVNSYAGIDALHASVEELRAMGRALAADGVLAYQPTLVSGEPEATCAAIERIGELVASPDPLGAVVLGVHLEGPFLSRAGTHPVDWLRLPDLKLAERLLRSGPVSMVTLAPELPGALELVAMLVRRGIVVSLGHSDASAQAAARAFDAGATAVTHLFNAMPPMSASEPGLVGRALVDERVTIQMIAGGGHVADELLRLAFAAAPGRCSLVANVTSLARHGKGRKLLGEVGTEVRDGLAQRPDGAVAGGAPTLASGVRRLVGLGIPLPEALAAATTRPAKLTRRSGLGQLRPGGPASLVILDDRLEVGDVLLQGARVGGR
jgi:N-acetylglucosamine-6-phosphate deacetylase